MNYYKILVANNKFHGNEALTYSAGIQLLPGQIVQLPLRKTSVSGIVQGKTTKPPFTTKQIICVQVETPLPAVSLKLLEWLHSYYPAPLGSIANLFVPPALLGRNPIPEVKPAQPIEAPSLPPLTDEQSAAIKVLAKHATQPALIHGNTGTGKTRLYIERARDCLDQGRSVMVLTPEIGLSSQLAHDLEHGLGCEVIVLHSNLSPQKRRAIWLRLLGSSSPVVVIGPRSVLFSPLHNLGLIVIDEAHDTSYKQDQLPYHNALRVAGKLAQLHKAQLIFGTATPLVSEYFYMEAKQLPIIRLEKIAAGDIEPPLVSVVDSKDRTRYSRNPYLSDDLLSAIQQALDNGEQSLLFLNRRGTARIILCQQCGWENLCPRCHVPVTYHGDTHSVRCHTCGFSAHSPVTCPSCGSTEILYKSIGTKALAHAVEQLFPHARVQRFDTDNKLTEKLENHREAVKSGAIDILVGTQVLIKGLDLPKLSLVGIVAADISLQFPDFTASEQTYQLLSQAIGRVGRGHRLGNVVIQTHNPSHEILSSVLSKNWSEYYQQQIAERKQFMFPPFCYLMTISGSRKSQPAIMKACQSLKEHILSLGHKVQIIGPSPSFIEQSKGSFNWQLVLKAKNRQELVSISQQLPAGWHYNIDPSNLL